MRFYKVFAFVLVGMLLLLCSCSNEGFDLDMQLSPSNTSLTDLASTIYNEQQLSALTAFKGSINELNAQYPVECLRKSGNTYRASYLGKDCVAVLIFDSQGDRLSGNLHQTQRLKSDFDSLMIGQALEDVQIIDPCGEYTFLYTGRNDLPKASTHYTMDGYLITVEYDESNTIIGIDTELI